MNTFISLKRSVLAGLAFGLMATLFAMAPSTLAAPIVSFVTESTDPFELHSYKGVSDNKGFALEIQNNELQSEIRFYIRDESNNDTLIETRNQAGNTNPIYELFSWDGKLGGQFAAPGTYTGFFETQDVNSSGSLESQPFEVTEEAIIESASAPDEWNVDSGTDFTVTYNLKTAVPACVMLNVSNEIVDFEELLDTGNDYELSWDGTLNNQTITTDGDYSWKLDIASASFCSGQAENLNAESGKVTVGGAEPTPLASPTINNFGVTINPFSPNDDNNQDSTTASFSLNEEAEVTMTVKTTGNVEVKKLIDGVTKNAGTVSAVWDGKDSGGNVVSDDNYRITVSVSNSSGNETKTIGVTVDTTVDPEPVENCGGYTDVPKNHPDCEAIKWVQDKGIITGNDDNTLGLSDLFQRDQSVKVAGEMRGIYNENANYCNGNPFPDVTGSAWSRNRVCQAKDEGIVTGYLDGPNAGKFVPGGTLNRYEAYAVLLRSIDEVMPSQNTASYNDVPTGQWFSGYAAFAEQNDLRGGNSFDGTDAVTRLEIIQIVYELGQLGYL